MNEIDNRIVSLEFDNKQFEQGVKESMNTLERLQKSLDLGELATKADFSQLYSSLDAISNKFNAMSIAGITAVQRLTNKAIDAGVAFTKSITVDQMSAGFDKYAEKTEAIQTMMAALPGVHKDVIYNAVNELAAYSDATSFDLANMTSNLAQFINNGVELGTATQAIKGIANAASLAGVSIQKTKLIMNNFSDALSAGAMELQDWNSLEILGMATKEFKEQIIEAGKALNKIDANGHIINANKKIKAMEVTYKNFAETLSAGWVDEEVMMRVLNMYADPNTDLGGKGYDAAAKARTYKEAIESVKDYASSQWMNIYETIFGDVLEAQDLWTKFGDGIINNYLDPIASKITDMFDSWKALDGRQALLKGLYRLNDAALRLRDILADAFGSVFGHGMTGQDLLSYTVMFREWADSVANWFDQADQNGITNAEKLTAAFTGLFSILKVGGQIIGSILGIAGKVFSFIFPVLQTVLDALGNIGAAIVWVLNGSTGEFSLIETIGNFLETVLSPVLALISTIITGISDGFVMLTTGGGLGFLESIGALLSETLAPVLAVVSNIISGIGQGIMLLFTVGLGSIPAILLTIGNKVKELLKSFKKSEAFQKFKEGFMVFVEFLKGVALAPFLLIGAVVSKLIEIIPTLVDKFLELGKTIANWFKTNKTIQKWVADVKKFFAPVTDLFTKMSSKISKIISSKDPLAELKDAVKKGINEIGTWFGVDDLVGKIKTAWEKIKNVLRPIKNAVTTFFSTLFGEDTEEESKMAFFPKIMAKLKRSWEAAMAELQPLIIDKVKAKLEKFKLFIKTFNSKDTEEEAKMGFFEKFAAKFKRAFDTAFPDVEPKIEAWFASLKKSIKDGINSVGGWFGIEDLAGKLKKKWEQAKKLFGMIKDAIQAFFGTLFGEDTAEESKMGFFEKTISKLNRAFSAATEKLQPIFDKIKAWKDKLTAWIDQAFPKEVDENAPWYMRVTSFIRKIWDTITGKFQSIFGQGTELAAATETANTNTENLQPTFFEKLGAFFQGVIDSLGSIDFGLIASIVTIAGTAITTLLTFYFRAKAFHDFGVAFKRMGEWSFEYEGIFGKAEGGKQNGWLSELADVIKQFGYLILEIAGSLAVLSYLNKDGKLLSAARILAGTTLVLSIILVALGRMQKTKWIDLEPLAEHVKSLSYLFGSIGVSFILIAIGMKIVAGLKWKQILKGLIVFGAIAVGLAILAGILSWVQKKFDLDGISHMEGLIHFAVAIGILALVTALIAKYADWENMGKAYLVILDLSLILIGLVAVIGLCKVNKVPSMLPLLTFVVAIFLLAVQAVIIGLIDETILKKGVIVIVVLGILLGAMMAVVSHFVQQLKAGDVIKILVVAVIMVAAIYAVSWVVQTMVDRLKDVPIETILTIVGSLLVAMVVLVAIAFAIAAIPVGFIKGCAILAAGIAILGVGLLVLTLLMAIGAQAIIKTINDFTTMLYSLGVTLNTYQTYIESVNFELIQSSLDQVGKMFTKMSGWATFNATGFQTFLTNLLRLGASLRLYGDLVAAVDPLKCLAVEGVILGLPAIKTALDDLKSFTDATEAIGLLGGAIKLYYQEIKDVDTENAKTPEDIAGMFRTLAQSVPSDADLAQVTSFANQDESGSLVLFAAGLEALGTAVEGFATSCGNITDDQISKITTALTNLTNLTKNLPKEEDSMGWIDTVGVWLSGRNQSLTTFSSDIVVLSQALQDFYNNINEDKVDFTRVSAAADLITKLSEIKTPTVGGIFSFFIDHPTDFATLGSQLNVLGSGMSDFQKNTAGKDYTGSESAVGIIKGLAEASNLMENSGGISQLITGYKDIGSLADPLSKLGPGLGSFADNTAGKDYTGTEGAIGILKQLIEAQKGMEGSNIFDKIFGSGGKNIGDFKEPLENLGKGLGSFADSTRGKDLSAQSIGIRFIRNLINLQGDVNNTTSNSIGTLGERFKTYATSLKDGSFKLREVDWDAADNGVKRLTSIVSQQKRLKTSDFTFDFNDLGQKMYDMWDWVNKLDAPRMTALQGVLALVLDSATVSAAVDPISKLGTAFEPFANAANKFTYESKDLGEIGTEFNTFIDNISGSKEKLEKVDWTLLNKAVTAVSRLSTQARKLYGITAKDMNFAKIGEDIAGMWSNLTWVEPSDLDTIAGAVKDMVDSMTTQFNSKGEELGKRFSAEIGTGILSNDVRPDPKLNLKSLFINLKGLDEVKKAYEFFEGVGKEIAFGLRDGIKNNGSEAEDAIESLMLKINRLGKDVPEVSSPSQVFTDIGMFIDRGLALGIAGNSYLAEGATQDLMNLTLNTAKRTLTAYTAAPNSFTIRPVIDMSNVYADFDSFGTSIRTTPLTLDQASLTPQLDPLVNTYIRSDNADVITSINGVSARLEHLEEAMSHLQVIMDTGALVGQTAPAMDRALGNRANRRAR